MAVEMNRIHLALLGPETSATEVTAAVDTAVLRGLGGLVVPPNLLTPARTAAERGVRLGSVAGFPSGKHHSLIKASEARLAVQFGAVEIAVVLDPVIARTDQNAVLAELVAVREAVPHPVQLAALVEPGLLDDAALTAVAATVRLAGVDRITAGTGQHALGCVDPEEIEILAAALADGLAGRPGPGLSAVTDEPTPEMVERLLSAGADRVLVDSLEEFGA